jgi:hypothetical protein
MATHNPSALYTGGAVTASTQPLASLYHQYASRKMARDEALDDYFRNLNKNINPAGVRQQDVEGLMQKTNEWNGFYQQNKQAIKNPKLDNGKALSEYQSRYQDQLAYIEKSKGAASTSKELARAKLNPQMGYMFDDDEILGHIQEHDKPLNDPTHKSIDIAQLNIQPKPIDLKEWQALQKSSTAGLKPSETVDKIEVDPKTLDTITTVKKSYSPEDLQAIGNRYKSMYQLDRRVRATTDKNLLNPANAGELNDVYKSVYGKNAETPADLLAAQGIQNAQTEGTIQKRTSGSLESKRLVEGMRQANRKDMVDYRQAAKRAGDAYDNLWVGEYVGKLMEDGKKGQEWDLDFKGNKTRERLVTTDPVIASALVRSGQEPDRVTVTPDGKIRGIYFQYKKDKDGNTTAVKDAKGRNLIDETLSSELLSPEQVKLALSKKTQSAKQRAEEMQAGGGEVPVKKPAPSASVDDIKKKFKLNY